MRNLFIGMICSVLWLFSCSGSKEKSRAQQQEPEAIKVVSMSDQLAGIYVDSLQSDCECVDALLKVTDLMIAVPESRGLEFDLKSISSDTVASKEIRNGHIVFRKIITKCVHELGVTQERLSTCENYEKANANTEKLKSLKLK